LPPLQPATPTHLPYTLSLSPQPVVNRLHRHSAHGGMEAFQDVGEAFVGHYYAAFDGDRSMLASLYSEDSMVSFEGKQVQGVEAILELVGSLQFQQVNRVLTTTDCQPVIVGGELTGILVSCLGQLQVWAPFLSCHSSCPSATAPAPIFPPTAWRVKRVW